MEADKLKNQSEGARKRIIASGETEEDVVVNLSLRPTRLKEFVGQKKVKDSLKVSIAATKKRNEPLEHILFSSPPGLGKTTLAHIIAHEMGTKITATSGPAIERAGDLIGILTNLERGDILFIDEIHRLSKVVEEFLYPAMENFQIDFVIDKGPYAKTIKFNLKPFTLIGASTRIGLLSSPLRGRFGISHYLDFYSEEDITEIIERSAKILNVPIDPDAAREIARRSRSSPRVGNRLLRRVRDYAQVEGDGRINCEIARRALTCLGIDAKGLDKVDRRVMEAILSFYKGGPVGIESLAASLNEEKDTITDTIEPYLLKIGFLKRTAKGRQLTELAYKHLNRLSETKKSHPELF